MNTNSQTNREKLDFPEEVNRLAGGLIPITLPISGIPMTHERLLKELDNMAVEAEFELIVNHRKGLLG